MRANEIPSPGSAACPHKIPLHGILPCPKTCDGDPFLRICKPNFDQICKADGREKRRFHQAALKAAGSLSRRCARPKRADEKPHLRACFCQPVWLNSSLNVAKRRRRLALLLFESSATPASAKKSLAVPLDAVRAFRPLGQRHLTHATGLESAPISILVVNRHPLQS